MKLLPYSKTLYAIEKLSTRELRQEEDEHIVCLEAIVCIDSRVKVVCGLSNGFVTVVSLPSGTILKQRQVAEKIGITHISAAKECLFYLIALSQRPEEVTLLNKDLQQILKFKTL